MASFAKIGLNGKVIEVQSVVNEVIHDSNGVEQESIGIDFLTKLTGWSIWKQTSYNNNFRKNFAGIGYTYDEDRDAFIPPKSYASWILNETTCIWEAPIVKPELTDEQESQNTAETHYWSYIWNESTTSWDLENTLV
tara:strand:- start:677 stop:1087 length:411 start_codon:yes stop_codon:yes gene_type:complete